MRQIKKVRKTSLETSGYELPIAGPEVLGGIKVGNNLNIDENGVLSANQIVIDGDGGTIAGEVLPIGTMVPYGSADNIPSNWKVCDGSEVSRTTYSELFKVIGTSYGEGDGETTFNLPDKRGRVSVGLDKNQNGFKSVGLKAGEKEHTLSVNEMPSHSHNLTAYQGTTTWQYGYPWGRASNESHMGVALFGTSTSGGSQPHNNLQPYEVDVWIIKVSNIVSVLEETTGTIIDNLTSTSSTDALSSNMGRVLNERITSIEENGVGGDSMVTYSTEEQRIGTWIDGKPLYQKVIVIGAVSTTEVATPTGASNIEQVVDIKGGGTMTAGQFLKWGFENAGGFCSCYYELSSNKVKSIVSTTNYNLKQAYAILEYTKTTD